MENQLILIDTSVLIDYYRKTIKEKTTLLSLVQNGYRFAVSVVTKYEIYAGASKEQSAYWDQIFNKLTILPLDTLVIDQAIVINNELKKSRNQIDIADLFIAATALSNQLSVSTLNKKHFERIKGLVLI